MKWVPNTEEEWTRRREWLRGVLLVKEKAAVVPLMNTVHNQCKEEGDVNDHEAGVTMTTGV